MTPKQQYEARKAQRKAEQLRRTRYMEEREKIERDGMTLAALAVQFAIAWLKGEAAIMIGQLEVRAKKDATPQ